MKENNKELENTLKEKLRKRIVIKTAEWSGNNSLEDYFRGCEIKEQTS